MRRMGKAGESDTRKSDTAVMPAETAVICCVEKRLLTFPYRAELMTVPKQIVMLTKPA